MNQKHSELIQAILLITVLLGIGLIFGLSFDYFTDGEISCYPLEKIKEIEENNFQFTIRCYMK